MAFKKSISSVACGLTVFGLRSGLKVERVFSGPRYPRSQTLETCSSISIEEMFASEIKRIYLDAIKLVFIRAKVSWKLSSIDAEKSEVHIDMLDTIAET
jgi:hypothetical protein